MSKFIFNERPDTLTLKQCSCGAQCKTYGFKQGTFYQGSGFDKETAERVASSYNACTHMDDPKEIVAALISLARDVESLELHHEQHIKARAIEILSHIRR